MQKAAADLADTPFSLLPAPHSFTTALVASARGGGGGSYAGAPALEVARRWRGALPTASEAAQCHYGQI